MEEEVYSASKAELRSNLQTAVDSNGLVSEKVSDLFLTAVRCDYNKEAHILLSYPFDLDTKTEFTAVPYFIEAVVSCNYSVIKELLFRGVDVNCASSQGLTSLYYAGRIGLFALIDLIVDYGGILLPVHPSIISLLFPVKKSFTNQCIERFNLSLYGAHVEPFKKRQLLREEADLTFVYNMRRYAAHSENETLFDFLNSLVSNAELE